MQNERITRLDNALAELDAAIMALANPKDKAEMVQQRAALEKARDQMHRIIKASITNLRDSIYELSASKLSRPSDICNIGSKLHHHGYVKIVSDGWQRSAVVTSIITEKGETRIKLLNSRGVHEELVFRTNVSKNGATITPYKIYQRVLIEDVRAGDYAVVDNMLVRVLDNVTWSKRGKNFKLKFETRIRGKSEVYEQSSKKHEIYEYAYRFDYDHLNDQIETSWCPLTLSMAAQPLICEALFYNQTGALFADPDNIITEIFKLSGDYTYALAMQKIIKSIMPLAKASIYSDNDSAIGVVAMEGNTRVYLTKHGVSLDSGCGDKYEIVTTIPCDKNVIARIEETLPHY